MNNRQWHRQSFELFLRRLQALSPNVIVGVVLLWQPCARSCWPSCPYDTEEAEDVLAVAKQYPTIPMFVVDASVLVHKLKLPTSRIFDDCHHPTLDVQNLIGDALFAHIILPVACNASPASGDSPEQQQHQLSRQKPMNSQSSNLASNRALAAACREWRPKLLERPPPEQSPPLSAFAATGEQHTVCSNNTRHTLRGGTVHSATAGCNVKRLMTLLLNEKHAVHAFTHYFNDSRISPRFVQFLTPPGAVIRRLFGRAAVDRVDRKYSVDIPMCRSTAQSATTHMVGVHYLEYSVARPRCNDDGAGDDDGACGGKEASRGESRRAATTDVQRQIQFVGLNLRAWGGEPESGTAWEEETSRPLLVTVDGKAARRLPTHELQAGGGAVLTRGLLDPQTWFVVQRAAVTAAPGMGSRQNQPSVVRVCMRRQGPESMNTAATLNLASLVFV